MKLREESKVSQTNKGGRNEQPITDDDEDEEQSKRGFLLNVNLFDGFCVVLVI